MHKLLLISLLLNIAPLQAASLADPTQPSLGGTASASGTSQHALTLNATYMGKTDRYAIINGVKLREGETLGHIRLQRIRHKSVDISADDRTQTLQLNDLIVKTR